MTYMNQATAIAQAKRILRHDNVRVVKRHGRFAFVAKMHESKDEYKEVVICVADNLPELLTELLQINVIAFCENHKFNIPVDAMFHVLAELYLSVETEDEAVALFAGMFGFRTITQQDAANEQMKAEVLAEHALLAINPTLELPDNE